MVHLATERRGDKATVRRRVRHGVPAGDLLAFPFAGVLHGAPVYTPGLIVTLVLGVFHARERSAARYALLAAAGVYLAALFFRTIDNEVCPVLPIGTHFVWHLLIGLVTYLAMRPLILSTATEVRARVR